MVAMKGCGMMIEKFIIYVKMLRIKHYVKNILIFLPLVFNKQIFDISLLLIVTIGFIAFSMMSSSVYIINDIKDIEKDRAHSTKCNRPIASGKISVKKAIIICVLLLFCAILLNMYLGFSILQWIAFMGYFIINVAYSNGLKNVPVLDVAILASGFLLRLFYGSLITDIPLSNWFFLAMICGAFYLGFGKRRNEIFKEGTDKRIVLKYYSYNFLDKNMYLCISLALMFYSLWTVDMSASQQNVGLIWTVPLIIVIVLKYNLNVERDSDGDPVEVIFRDKLLMWMIIVFAIILTLLLYMM